MSRVYLWYPAHAHGSASLFVAAFARGGVSALIQPILTAFDSLRILFQPAHNPINLASTIRMFHLSKYIMIKTVKRNLQLEYSPGEKSAFGDVIQFTTSIDYSFYRVTKDR